MAIFNPIKLDCSLHHNLIELDHFSAVITPKLLANSAKCPVLESV